MACNNDREERKGLTDGISHRHEPHGALVYVAVVEQEHLPGGHDGGEALGEEAGVEAVQLSDAQLEDTVC